MPERPYTLLSCCMSLDGYLDDAGDERLLLSNEADFDRVDRDRARSDAILVGAATVRHDDPRLRVRSSTRQPWKVTVTNRAKLDPTSRFFTVGDVPKLVYCAADTLEMAREQLGAVATVVDGGRPIELRRVAEDLHRRGVRRLMVEGGGDVHTQLLTEGLADELRLAVAPVFVGDPQAIRFVGAATFPFTAERRARLVGTRPVGDVVLLRYALSDRFEEDAW